MSAPNPVDPGIGLRNMSRAFLKGLPLLVGGTALLAATTELGFFGSLNYALLAQILLTFPWAMTRLVRQFRARGRLLLDCGPHPQRWAAIALSVLMGGMGSLPLLFPGLSLASSPGQAPLFLVASAAMLSVAFTRLQLTENGIWAFDGLLRWDQIRAYRWTGDSTLWIEVEAKGGVLGPHRGALPVPPEHMDRLEASLVRHGVARGSEPDRVAEFLTPGPGRR